MSLISLATTSACHVKSNFYNVLANEKSMALLVGNLSNEEQTTYTKSIIYHLVKCHRARNMIHHLSMIFQFIFTHWSDISYFVQKSTFVWIKWIWIFKAKNSFESDLHTNSKYHNLNFDAKNGLKSSDVKYLIYSILSTLVPKI